MELQDGHRLVTVDYKNDEHGRDLLWMLNNYAESEEGGAQPLADYTKRHLISELASRDGAVSILYYIGGRVVGLLNAFEGFSTFSAKPLYNVHDLAVVKSEQGQGIAGTLLGALADLAKDKGCCKLTLEVLSNNTPALKCYEKNGFKQYVLSDGMGHAQFWQRPL